MALIQTLEALVNERLSAAAEEIFGTVGQIVTEYEEEALSLKQEIDRKSRLLDMVLKPYIKLYRADILHIPLFKEGVYPEQEEPQHPQFKEEQEELLLRPDEGLALQAVKSEDDGENRETAAVTSTSAEHKETTDANYCGTAQPLCKEHISIEQQENNYCLVKEELHELLQRPAEGLTATPQNEQYMNSTPVQPPQIKEEKEELLLRPDEGLTFLAVKREVDGENTEKEPVVTADHMKTQTGVEECAPQPTSDSHCSESDTEDSDEWEETKEYQPANMEGKRLPLSKNLTQNLKSQKQVKRHTEKNVFNCKDCDKKFTSKANLKVHTMTHTGEYPFNCTVCGRGCSTKRDLKRHMMTHTGEKPFTCTVCGKGFSHKRDLKRHMMTHTGEKPFTCTVCGKGCIQKGVLKTHMMSHTGEKPFTCTICGNCFSLKCNLNTHMMSHTGEKPFTCTVCGKGCILKSDLNRHMVTHTGEKPFTCTVCGKGFSQKVNLNRHLRTHTEGEHEHMEI